MERGARASHLDDPMELDRRRPLRGTLLLALACCAPAATAQSRTSPSRAAQATVQDAAPTPVQEAERAWAAGERADAIARLHALLGAGDEVDPTLLEQLVRWELTVHRYEAALRTLERGGSELGRFRGEALYALTRYAEALEHLDPTHPPHVLLIVDAHEARGDLTAADAALERARETLGASDPRLSLFEGRAAARAGDHERAAGLFQTALDSDPWDQAARFGLGRSLIALGERERGLAELAEHRRLTPLVDALDFARQSLDLAPNHAPNIAAVGDAERALGRPERALGSYRRALGRAEPAQITPIALRAARVLESDLGRAEDAIDELERAFARAADVRLAVRAGDVAARAGLSERALSWYDRALELRPDDPTILARRGQVR